MKTILPFLAVLILFVPISESADTLWPRWMMFYGLGALLLTSYFAKKYTISLGAVIGFSIVSGSMVFVNRSQWSNDMIHNLDLAHLNAKAVITLLTCVFIGHLLTRRALNKLILAFIAVCSLSGFISLLDALVLGTNIEKATGLMGNVSMGSSIMGVLFPFILKNISQKRGWRKQINIISAVIFVSTVVMQGSSMGYASLCAGVLVWWFLKSRDKVFTLCFMPIPAGLLFLCGSFVDHNWLHPEKLDRLTMWKYVWDFWANSDRVMGGFGIGTFSKYGPHIQGIHDFQQGHAWIFSHSDLLQVLFETGVVGFSASILLWVTCVWRAFITRQPALVSSLIALMVICAGNYPLRLAESTVLVTLLVARALKPANGVLG